MTSKIFGHHQGHLPEHLKASTRRIIHQSRSWETRVWESKPEEEYMYLHRNKDSSNSYQQLNLNPTTLRKPVKMNIGSRP